MEAPQEVTYFTNRLANFKNNRLSYAPVKGQIAFLILLGLFFSNCQKENVTPLEKPLIEKPSIELNKIILIEEDIHYTLDAPINSEATECKQPECQTLFAKYKELFQAQANQFCQSYQFNIECCYGGVDATLVHIIIRPDETTICQKEDRLSLSENQSKHASIIPVE